MKEVSVLQCLRAVKLRPTVARIGVLQVIQASGDVALSAEQVYVELIVRGMYSSMGTIYRILNQCENSGLLLREWDSPRKALFRLKPPGFEAKSLHLGCRRCGRQLPVDDAALLECVVRAAQREGICVGGGTSTIELACTKCSIWATAAMREGANYAEGMPA